MKYFFLIAAFNAIFFMFLILQKKKSLHDRILIFWLGYLGVYVGVYALFSEKLFAGFHILSAGFISLLMLHGPFLYLYISALISEKFRFRGKHLFHFVPFILFNIYLLFSSFSPEITERIGLDHADSGHNTPLLFNLFLLSTVLSGPLYFLSSISLFKKQDIHIYNNFSTSENINPDWLRKLVYSFGAIWTILMIITIIHHIFQLFSRVFCTDGMFLSLSVFIILIGYFGLKQKEIFIQFANQEIEYVTTTKARYSGVLLKEADAEQYLNRLQSYMGAEKPYLDENLTLPELAARLQIPSHVLSRVINEKLGMNFFDYVNRFRIEEVKVKMRDPQFNNLSLLGIAFECGFSTKSAFNRVFKKITGLTPSEYKKQL